MLEPMFSVLSVGETVSSANRPLISTSSSPSPKSESISSLDFREAASVPAIVGEARLISSHLLGETVRASATC